MTKHKYHKKKEFNLSDKIKEIIREGCLGTSANCYEINKKVQKVFKEAVKILKEDFHSSMDLPNTNCTEIKVFDYVMKQIDKIFGEKLI